MFARAAHGEFLHVDKTLSVPEEEAIIWALDRMLASL
jgi:hypothetical protein